MIYNDCTLVRFKSRVPYLGYMANCCDIVTIVPYQFNSLYPNF